VSLRTEVIGDIELCEEIIKNNDVRKAEEQISILVGAYGNYIPGIQSNLDTYTLPFDVEVDYIGDIRKIKKVLELFYSNGCKLPGNFKENRSVSINNQNINTSLNKIDIAIDINFNEVRQEIKNNGSLHQEEIEKILSKLDEIEEISNSPESRNEKWAKLKGSLEWLSTKGVDIATKILPLILKAVEN